MADRHIVGREPELAALDDALTGVVAGRGLAVLVEGEPGIGKSALVGAALARAAAEISTVRGACDEWGRRFALSAVISAFEGADGAAAATGLPAPHAFAAGAVPRSVAADPVMAAVDFLLLHLERLCAAGPVVFVLEDLHWADEATLMFWRELCGRTDRLPLLLIGTRRPVPRRPRLDRLREEVRELGGTVLVLSGLGRDDVVELATRLPGRAAGSSLLTLLETASGNPLYIRELLDALSGPGVTDLPELPASVADWLDLLAPGSLDVLRGAAVLGAGFSPRELAVLLDKPTDELRVLLEEPIAAGLLEIDDGTLRFRHELIRRKLYEAMPVGLRLALHRYTAKVLDGLSAEPERVARHLLAGQDVAERWEADWLLEHAAAVYEREPETAVDLLGQLLRGLDPDDPRYAALEDRWVRFTFQLDRYEQAGRIARGILTRASDPTRIGLATWILALSLMSMTRFDEALNLLEEAGRRPGIPAHWRARHDAVRAILLQILGRLDEAHLAAEHALAAEVTPADPFTVSVALYLRSIVQATRRDLAGALRDVQRGLAIVIQDPDLADVRMLLLGNWHAYRFALGQNAGVATAMRQVLAMAERTGSPWLGRVRRQAAKLLYDFGDWSEATAHLQPYQESLRHAIGAMVAVHRDESAEAARHLKALSARAQAPSLVPSPVSGIYAVAARALEAERNGSPVEGVAVLSVCLEPGAQDEHPMRHLVMPTLVRLALAVEDRATALEAGEAAAYEAGRERTARKQACAEWCHGLLAADPKPILRAVDYYRVAGLRLDLGNALEDAAELLARSGDAEWARHVLREAFAVYEALGATWDARRGAARLRAYDVRLGVTGSRAAAGGSLLTPTERRVAELAAEGCSNPDIASRMFLSRRTVETHISNILAKLRIGSRREIRDRLEREGP